MDNIHNVAAERSPLETSLKLSWVTVALFAAVIAYVDGFWATSLHGAIGAVSRTQGPFGYWWRSSTLMLPLYVAVVVAALVLARRWFERRRRTLFGVGAAALLMIVMTAGAGAAEMAVSSAHDYHVQVAELSTTHAAHAHHEGASAQLATGFNSCIGVCAAQRTSRIVHIRAVEQGTVVLLITNVVLVAFLLVMRSDRLWLPRAAALPLPA